MWLLDNNIRHAMQHATTSGFTPTASQLSNFEARLVDGSSQSTSRLLTVVDGVAEISVTGTLTNTPDMIAMFFGGGNTTYSEIITAIKIAENDSSVNSVVFNINSGGGHFDGLFDALAAMQNMVKPTKSIIHNLGASAAFAIATQADTVYASNIAARIGSVGVAVTFYNDDHEIDITSTESPKKRPDVKTDEGVDMVREELDALHEIFVEAIANGRGISATDVNANFGRGATVLANDALKRGMIDGVLTSMNHTTTTTANSGKQPEAINMDLQQLQAQHPETFAAAVQQGIDSERDRVTAHLTMGESSGDMKTACEAISSGTAMTATLQATYMAAGMNRSDVSRRQQDDASATAGDNATVSDDTDVASDVVSLIESKLGLGA